MLVIQIRIVEWKEENLILVYLKKGEGSKKYFLFQNPKKKVKKNMLYEIDSSTAQNGYRVP